MPTPGKPIIPLWVLLFTLFVSLILAIIDRACNGRSLRFEEKLIQEDQARRI